MDDSDRAGDFTKALYPEPPLRGIQNVTNAVVNRQLGWFKGVIPNEFQRAAEDKLVEKQVLEEMTCTLPDSPRSTFLMVFSPDGKKVASTHGNHNVYVTDLTTGKNIQTLTGHPRTPWCIAFHPSSNQILATGCLGGQVRVWDLSGGSEVWTAESQTVIASLAFHPIDRMLVIATYNELHFWDWSQPEPFAKCSTKTDREKVRYVTFDRLGNKLITGIANQVPVQSQWDVRSSHVPATTSNTTVSSSVTGAPLVAPTSERERSIAFCYRNLMNQYNQLVRRYFDLSRSRVTPTMDRGTDPMDIMDTQNMPSTSGTSVAGPSSSGISATGPSNNGGSADEPSGSSTSRPSPVEIAGHLAGLLGYSGPAGPVEGPMPRSVGTTRSLSSADPCPPVTWPLAIHYLENPRTLSSSPISYLGSNSHPSSSAGPSTLSTTTADAEAGPITSTALTDPDVESTSSGSGSEATTPVSSVHAEIHYRAPGTTTTTTSGNHLNPFMSMSRADSTTPTYTWSRGVVSPREGVRDTSTRDSGPYSTDLLRALLRDVASSESQSSEDTELEMAARSGSPRVVVSRADSDHPRPVPTFQLRPRLMQDPSHQLRYLANRETFGTIANAPPSSRRMLMRPGGQFVLSRHSNSPFQPRVPLRMGGPPVTQPPATAPSIPSQASSFSPARRLLYDQVRVFLRDRMRSATESSSSDTTTNYSRLAREPDADAGPDISWDSDSETLIIRPRSSTSRTLRPPEDPGNIVNSGEPEHVPSDGVLPAETLPSEGSTDTDSNIRDALRDLRSPSVRHGIEVLSSHIESMQRLVRARIEVLQMQDMRSAWRTLRDEIRVMPRDLPDHSAEAGEESSTTGAPSSSSSTAPRNGAASDPDDGTFERHLRGQVRRLRAVVSELRGGIEGVVRGHDVSSLLQSASLDDTPPPPPPPPPSSSRSDPPDNTSLMPDYQKLATALARDLLLSPGSLHPQPGPSSATSDDPTDEELARLTDQLKAVVLRVALRRLDGEQIAEPSEPQPGPSRVQTPPPLPPPWPPRAPTNPRMPRLAVRLTRLGPAAAPRRPTGGAENTLRADGFHREQLGGWRTMAARLSSSEDRRYHRNKLRGGNRDREALRARVKRTVRAMLRGRGRVGLQDLFNRGLLGLTPEGICLRYPSGEGSHRRGSTSDSVLRAERHRSDGSGTTRDTCRSCGLRKPAGSSLKRKGSNPQRFRADKFARDGNGGRRPPETSSTRMLQSMIDRMQNIVRMQREALPTGFPMPMTSEERAFVSEISEEVRQEGLPVQVRCSNRLLYTFRRHVSQLRAHQLLNSMVHSVSAFFEGNASHMVDREIMKLYNLLQLALELTDLLLEQLQTSRGVASEPPRTSDTETLAHSFTAGLTQASSVGTDTSQEDIRSDPISSTPNQNTPSPPLATANSQSEASSPSTSTSDRRRVSFRLPASLIPSRYTNVSAVSVNESSQTSETNSEDNSSSRKPCPLRLLPVRFSPGRTTSSSSAQDQLRNSTPSASNSRNDSSPSTSRYYSILGYYSNNSSNGSSPAGKKNTSAAVSSPQPATENSTRPSRPPVTLSERGSKAIRTQLRRFFTRDRGRSFDRLMDAHRRRQGMPSRSESDIGDEQELPRGRSNAMHRYRRPRLWPVARVAPGGQIIGCLRRQRNVGLMRHDSRVWRPSTADFEMQNRDNARPVPPQPSTDAPLPPMPQFTPRNLQWVQIRQMGSEPTPPVPTPPTTSESGSGFTVPLLRVNDVLVSDPGTTNSPRTRPPPLPPHGEEMSRWRYYRPRFLHPRYFGPNPFDETDTDNAEGPAFYRMLSASSGHSASVYTLDPIMITEAPVSPHHRIQAWDFSHHVIPEISNRELNGVVGECKIHNDASVDVSSDGQLLVTLLPSGRLSVTTMLGVYSLEWSTLGQLLYKTGFDQNAVSVSLSPTARHLLVGLASRPLALRDRDRTNMAQIFRLGGAHALPAGSWHSGRGVLQLVRDLEQTREMNVMSVNCIRWAPAPGHGLVYGTNTGQLKILR